jgi:preprotein translocase subunit SecD
MLDKDVLWGAPVVQTAITGNRCAISVSSSEADANQLAAGFRGGALPAPLTLISEEPVE